MKIIFSILTLFFCVWSFAQQVVFVNANGGSFRDGTEICVALQIDRDTSVQLQTITGQIDFTNYKVDSLATLKVNGTLIDEYYNEYTPKQFGKIDTIALFQIRMFGEATPRFFPEMNYDLDSALRFDALWFKSFLEESYYRPTFKLMVYHTYHLTKRDKREIRNIKTKFCNELGVDENSIELAYSDKPYETVRYNFFNQKTLISKSFIDRQNTPNMKHKAKEYSCAIVVEMIWKKN